MPRALKYKIWIREIYIPMYISASGCLIVIPLTAGYTRATRHSEPMFVQY